MKLFKKLQQNGSYKLENVAYSPWFKQAKFQQTSPHFVTKTAPLILISTINHTKIGLYQERWY